MKNLVLLFVCSMLFFGNAVVVNAKTPTPTTRVTQSSTPTPTSDIPSNTQDDPNAEPVTSEEPTIIGEDKLPTGVDLSEPDTENQVDDSNSDLPSDNFTDYLLYLWLLVPISIIALGVWVYLKFGRI